MNCTKYKGHLYLYAAGELSERATAEFERHLSQCENCQREMAMYQQVIQNYQALLQEPNPEIKAETILNRIQQRTASKRYLDHLPRVLIPATAAVLLLFISLFALYTLHIRNVKMDEQSTTFISIFDEPSLFETKNSIWDIPQLDIHFPYKEPLTYLAQDIASLRRPEGSLIFRSSHDRRIQHITKQIHMLSNYEALHNYLHTDSILRRKIL